MRTYFLIQLEHLKLDEQAFSARPVRFIQMNLVNEPVGLARLLHTTLTTLETSST